MSLPPSKGRTGTYRYPKWAFSVENAKATAQQMPKQLIINAKNRTHAKSSVFCLSGILVFCQWQFARYAIIKSSDQYTHPITRPTRLPLRAVHYLAHPIFPYFRPNPGLRIFAQSK